MRHHRMSSGAAAIALAALTACGGGGGGGGGSAIVSTPAPVSSPPTPAPAPGTAIAILPSPATQEFTTFTEGGADAQLRIRYDAATSVYEVQTAGSGWTGLRDSDTYSSDPNVFFAFGPTAADQKSFFFAGGGSTDYASVAVWGKGVGAYWDDASYTAFGTATPAGGVPVTGSASYAGNLVGASSYREDDYLVGGTVASWIGGDITLAFDFGSGTLSGSIAPTISSYAYEGALPTLAIKDPVFGVGATGFGGAFDTALAGNNSFSGSFAGPNAEEVMGKFAFPFVLPGTSDRYDAWGAFVGKR